MYAFIHICMYVVNTKGAFGSTIVHNMAQTSSPLTQDELKKMVYMQL